MPILTILKHIAKYAGSTATIASAAAIIVEAIQNRTQKSE